MYNKNRKRQDLKRLCQEISYLCNNRLAGGGYCAFMGNIIIKIINTKSAISSFFAISTMLTFHKHTPFHRLSISACEYKSVGITAGVNTAFEVSPLTSDCSDNSYYTLFIPKIQDLLIKNEFQPLRYAAMSCSCLY